MDIKIGDKVKIVLHAEVDSVRKTLTDKRVVDVFSEVDGVKVFSTGIPVESIMQGGS